jgi:hypothetical protein
MKTAKPTYVIITLLLLAVLFGFIFLSYNNRSKMMAAERFFVEQAQQSPADYGNAQYSPDAAAAGVGAYAPSDPSGNATPGTVTGVASGPGAAAYGPAAGEGSPSPACFPRDRLTPDDLLPKDAANSLWAKQNPAVGGDVRDQNFLTAGHHVGIDTVGSSMKNPNLQLRSEPPNPMRMVSPWLQSTITYSDINRRPLEIGGEY